MARPSQYKPEYTEQTYKFCLLGATDEDLANFFEVTTTTIDNWKNKKPEFLGAIKRGKEIADAEVGKSLYQRANGYEHKEDKIFLHEGETTIVETTKHYPPDPVSMIFWLKNRQAQKWRDRKEVDLGNDITINVKREKLPPIDER